MEYLRIDCKTQIGDEKCRTEKHHRAHQGQQKDPNSCHLAQNQEDHRQLDHQGDHQGDHQLEDHQEEDALQERPPTSLPYEVLLPLPMH